MKKTITDLYDELYKEQDKLDKSWMTRQVNFLFEHIDKKELSRAVVALQFYSKEMHFSKELNEVKYVDT